MERGKHPVSIPNLEVKPLIADGTAPLPEWESRTSPGFFYTDFKIAKNSTIYGAIK